MTLFEQRDRIVKEIIKPAFKNNGFTGSGTTFKKVEKDFIKIFNIQSSGFNFEDNLAFFLNIGLLFPIWYEIQGEKLPQNPKEYDCQFRIRSNSLTGNNEIYRLTPEVNFQTFDKLIKDELNEFILPFYSQLKSLEDCLKVNDEFLNNPTDMTPYIALTMIKNGDIQNGNNLLDSYLLRAHQDWKNSLIEYRNKLTNI